MLESNQNQTLNASTFNGFRKIVHEKSGISLGKNKMSLVQARVGKRMRALGMTDHRSYLRHVSNDHSGEEIVHLLDAISTNVTSFFRESQHFDLLTDAIADWLSKGKIRIRIWSAACSSGEEPYTIAMVAHEAAAGGRMDLRILATDISTKVLERAREGIYDASIIEKMPAKYRNKYCTRIGGRKDAKQFQVDRKLASIIAFKRLNLSTPPFPMKGPFDVVFCRNVMIYFENDVRVPLLREISRLLSPKGILFVGHSENLTGMISDFYSVGPSVYVKGQAFARGLKNKMSKIRG